MDEPNRMCLMMYLGSAGPVPESESPDLTVERPGPAAAIVCRWFTLPEVRYLAAHGGCSCGFPHLSAEGVVQYFDGMFDRHDERTADLRSVTALVALIGRALDHGDRVELLPVWNGEEDLPPKGTIDWALPDLDPERVIFNERYLHRVVRGAARGAAR